MSLEPPVITSVTGLHTSWPSAGKSPFGWVCIILGGFLALVTVATPLAQFFNSKDIGGPIAALPTILTIALGAWLGAGVYCLIGLLMKAASPRPTESQVVVCAKCGQRIPPQKSATETLAVCPSCDHPFQT